MQSKIILVTGGGGYVGSVLVPTLLERGYAVKALDTFLFGDHVLDAASGHPGLTVIKGDIRDHELIQRELKGVDVVIHLAAISNDPSADLDPKLTWSINRDAACALLEMAKTSGINRFIFASSASVYGVKKEPDVTEDLALEPLTLYAKTKAETEAVVRAANSSEFTTVALRPATICGCSPRQRLDLTVNILTNHAVNQGKITVFGGEQKRPNLHIKDMVNLYAMLIEAAADKIGGEVFNVAYQNHTVLEIAEIVQRVVGSHVTIERTGTNDYRSYRISSEKICRILGYQPKHTIEDAVSDLMNAFAARRIPNPNDPRYYNVKWMQAKAVK